MVMVCKNHITKGVNLLPAPHVQELPKYTKKCCSFCEEQAILKLFLLDGFRG
jgi:hypothetical protein